MAKTEQDDEIKADQWAKMNLQQLHQERDKVVKKMSLLQNLMALQGSPSIVGLYKALEHGLDYLTKMIDARSQK